MRVKVEDDAGTLLALLVIDERYSDDHVTGWELHTPDHMTNGNSWTQSTPVETAGKALLEAGGYARRSRRG